MNDALIEGLIEIAGEEHVIFSPELVKDYLYDETEIHLRPKANEHCVVVKPGNTAETAAVMKLANRLHTVVVVRGGGTGLCGGATPVKPGILLSMERFKRILELDEKNFIITLECGVSLDEMNEYLKENSSLYFPSHSGDGRAELGGLAAENAGGSKTGKHGVMRNNIKGLEVVLPTGKKITLGGKIRKNNAGYDLLQLMIGSEGTLGVVTKVMLQLYPKPSFNGTILVSFNSFSRATEAATKVLQMGVTPLSIEYLDRSIALRAAKYLEETWPLKEGTVDLLFIVSEDNEDTLFNVSGIIEGVCSSQGALESLVLDGQEEQERILNIRSNTYYAVKSDLADTLDITVPRPVCPVSWRDLTGLPQNTGR